MSQPGMSTAQVYRRTVGLLGGERWLATGLSATGVAIAIVQLAEPVLFGRMVDSLARGTGAFALIGTWAAFGLVGIFASAITAVSADRLAHRARLAALGAAFSRAITLPISYHAERGTGSVTRAILAGTDALFVLWLGILREQLTALAGILLLIPTAISIDPRMAAILALLGVVYLALNILVIRKTREGQARVESHSGRLYGRVGDVLGNVTVVQSYSRLAGEMQAMRQMTASLLAAQYPVLTWWGLLTVLTRAAATVTMVIIFAAGALLAQKGQITVGEIVSFGAFAGLMVGQLDRLSSFVGSIFRSTPTIRSYFELLDAPAEVTDTPRAVPLVQPVLGHVEYREVSYRFPGSEQGVFDLSFTALPGQTIALVGPTGSGKTTTLALLQRLRQPDQGSILVDGHDIAGLTLASLRDNIAVVFQEAGLFNRSIAENIRVGRPEATDAEVEQAARLAEAHQFILRKPGNYSFVIGERGNALSGGERQRLAIARAVLKHAPILIMDEATSALDPATEARIKRAIDKLRANRTTLIIAHRLSTVASADQILVLDAGRIVERGNFAELTRQDGLFAHLVREGEIVEPKAD
ncbi:glucan ABC transporter ATP-binding protein/ permease [Paracoccus sp. CPCC 101403]|uniref:Glucan ABC transporter ATP-binding protein/ permease n=1 Tax=Paracoccus broussonetiae TaxID=3075834 RepID=A0ABU3EB47_9RHOB|nr:glucan ABC transporter ATP-binding protein/ permease [Paracoccus sp. CPCC 101403]MDT1061360.1 glucan ABC transporter ATP-binding protein/ permease [Paracoccus sp. CPCC 101403]